MWKKTVIYSNVKKAFPLYVLSSSAFINVLMEQKKDESERLETKCSLHFIDIKSRIAEKYMDSGGNRFS